MRYKLKTYGLDIDLPKAAPAFFKDIIEDGSWEQYECQIIQKAVKGHRVLEGGSGIGVTTILLDKRAEFVISFEANPVMADAARKNQALNGSSAKIIDGAIGVGSGVVKFDVKPDLWDSKLSSKNSSGKKVKLFDTADIIRENRINALVLDVEGEEEKILKSIDLSPIKLIIVELHSHVDKESILERLQEAGFVRKNQKSKADHSVVWAERKSSIFTKIISRLGINRVS
jgi:FkbM family methyltransferase